MASQVEVQSGEVGRTMTGGRLHLSPLTDSSNTSPSLTQSHMIPSEPKKPVPGPKPRLTPKPFAVEKSTIKPIPAPKPQTKPRPESTNTAAYKPELPNSPKPQQPVAIVKPRPVSTNSTRPATTSFRTSTKVNGGQTIKPAVHPFKPAPPLDAVDTNKSTPPLPAERQKPKDQLTSIQGGGSITRAKSLGFLNQIEKEDEHDESVTVVPPRPQPRGSRPRPVSAVFVTDPEIPVPAPRLAGGKPLSPDLTSKFESIGLSLHRKAAKANVKESTPNGKAIPQNTQQEKNSSSDVKVKQATTDEHSNNTAENIIVKEDKEDQRGGSIKSRINLLLDSSSAPEAVSFGQKSAILSPEQTVPESEPQVGVKQLIKQLTMDTTPTHSPVLKPVLKTRHLHTDLTKKFSSERLSDFGKGSLSEVASNHQISQDPQRRIEATNLSCTMAVDLRDQLQKSSSMAEILEAEQVSSAISNQSGSSVEVDTVRASLPDNNVEISSVNNGAEFLSNHSVSGGSNEDTGPLVTVTYKDPVCSSPQRVSHTVDTVQNVGGSRVVSESIPSAQREDKAMTLRSRRSEGNKPMMETTDLIKGEPSSAMAIEQQPRYLRIGSLQKWPITGLAQEVDVEDGVLKQSQRGKEMDLIKDRQREADHEEIAAAPKRMKTLSTDEKTKPKATYFALTGQIQDSVSSLDTGSDTVGSEAPYDDIDSEQVNSQDKVVAIKRNLSINETSGEKTPDKIEEVRRMSHISARHVVSALAEQTAEKVTGVTKGQQSTEDERQNGKIKIIDEDKRRQMEIEKKAIFQFAQMKERELQREFERRKALEREKQKQKDLQNQNLQEFVFEGHEDVEKQTQLYFKQEKAKQQEQEIQMRQEVEKQKDLARQRVLEKQRQQEILNQREKEMARQQMVQRQREQELERQHELMRKKEAEMEKQLQQMRMRELEKEQLRELERQEELMRLRQKEMDRQQEQMRLKEQEKERLELRRLRDQENEWQKELERQREMERQQEMIRLKEQERERQRELERQQELMRLTKQLESRQQEVWRQQEQMRLREQEIERHREHENERQELDRQEEYLQQREHEIERRREVERQHTQMNLRQQEQMRLKEQEIERRREIDLQKEHENMRREIEKQHEQIRQGEQEIDRQRDVQRQQEQMKLREQELERRRELAQQEKLRVKAQEMEKLLELERQQREQEKERQNELERQQDQMRLREKELERWQELKQQEQLRVRDQDMERLHDLERQQREQEMERQRELERQQDKARLREQEIERQRELKLQQELRQKENEMERQQELEQQQEQVRKRKQEMERLRELERQQQHLRQKEQEMEKQQELAQHQEEMRLKEQEKRRLRGFHEQQEMEQERQRDWERQRQKDEARQTELDKETFLLEMQRNKRMEEMERFKKKNEERIKENERYLDELDEQQSIEQAERKKMSYEQDVVRLRGIDKEREKQRQLEMEREEAIERKRLKELDRLRDLQREKQLHAEKQNQQLIQQALQNERLSREAGGEKMEKAEADRMRQIARLQEAERHRLKEKQRKEEQERMGMDQSPLRPRVVDVDSLLRTSQHIDPALRWKEPSPRTDEPYKPSILDVDSFKSQSHFFSNQDVLSVSGIQEMHSQIGSSISRPSPERDITWKVPPPTSANFTSPEWTISSHDSLDPQPYNVPHHQPRKHTHKISPEQLLFRQDEHSQSHYRHRQGDTLYLDPFVQRESKNNAYNSVPVDQVWLPRELKSQDNQEEVWNHRRSQGSKELNRMRSRSMSRRSAPSGVALEKSLSRIRSRSAHREQNGQSREQQKQGVSGENERKDSVTPVGETDSQYGTWETGLRTDDSLTPATPSSESNLSPSPRNTTPSHPQTEPDSFDGPPQPPPKPESQPLLFPDAPTTLLDTAILRSKVQLGKKRAPRTRPSRAARQNFSQAGEEGATSDDWLYRDSTGEKVERKTDEVDSEEQAGGAAAAATFASQPQRIALFPGVDSQAIKIQLKKRSDSDNPADAPSPSLSSRSPKSPFLPRAARVLPPAGGIENGEEESPQWLKELKSKKRLSQYESES
ncbi:trichohyalin isoform X2 [Corythoichthys intestinalis]|nr:trichohyalin isoform X2 [Corythoichthys intestinalis]XP_057688385.1 trichohyalin isoform X2 [Corythoichthys intestinalis]XP_057688386.1 trichohyalin isoform X2 [Corythoichthys intestinalis]XP_057688387.1 trichohyalin isoform X2 [Corythoichthys intestinalis]XP_057688388.1 trichohyalin isoform X2 [Corythoichthys intestinalis]